MKQGTLVRDLKTGRMVIRYSLEEYSDGLHCGTTLEVKVGTHWKKTRIEHNGSDWYLPGIHTNNLEGLSVRKETYEKY